MQERQNGRYINRGSQYYSPAPPPTQPATQAPQEKPRVLKPATKRFSGIVFIAILVVVATTASVLLYMNTSNSPLPRSVAKQVNFPLYLPDDSQGVKIDKDSYSFQEGALTYTARTPDNRQVFLSEQHVPKSFDLTGFLQHIKNKQTVANQYGQGQAGISENNLIISQIIGDTWIFMSGPIDMEPAQLTRVFQSLKRSD
jgi:hypothetical protein